MGQLIIDYKNKKNLTKKQKSNSLDAMQEIETITQSLPQKNVDDPNSQHQVSKDSLQ